jgi:hypothetical protein
LKQFFPVLLFLLVSCTPATQITPQAEIVTVYATPAAEPWLTELYACAHDRAVTLNINAQEPQIYLRIGEPETLLSPAYQIDEEEILIVTHHSENPMQNLSLEEAQALFAGQGDPSMQVWVYASDEDVQIAFDQLVMKGRSVTSFARLATSPRQMSEVLNTESNAVGILPRHWKTGNSREVFSAGSVAVLAVTKEEPQGAVKELITCLQNN